MASQLVYEEVGFNADVIAKKSAADFIKEHGHLGLNNEQLAEVHKLATEAVKSAPKEKAGPVVSVTHLNAEGNAIVKDEEKK